MSELADEARALGPWFHNLHLPDGTQTAPDHPLGDFPYCNWLAFATRIPRDLTGWKVLDIGCNAGYYSFRVAKWGAEVTGIDLDERYLKQARWAAEVYGVEDRVRFEKMQVYDLAHSEERYDLVLFLGVLYHLRYPLLGLDIVRDITRRKMVFQTLTTPGDPAEIPTAGRGFDEIGALEDEAWPQLHFVEHAFAEDPTNWWIANRPAVRAMLRSSGFEIENDEGDPFLVCRVADQEPAHRSWDRSEFLAATGRPWQEHADLKTVSREGTLERPRTA